MFISETIAENKTIDTFLFTKETTTIHPFIWEHLFYQSILGVVLLGDEKVSSITFSSSSSSLLWLGVVIGSPCCWAPDYMPHHIWVESWSGIHSCLVCLAHSDLVQPIHLQVKPQLISNTCLDAFWGTLHPGHWFPSRKPSTQQWLHT